MQVIRIATRQSPLALWQANEVSRRLQLLYPDLQIELIKISTKGDNILDSPLNKIGGKGLFVKELEQSLLQNQADIAVHSMKDVPMELPDGLHLPVMLERDDPHDAFVSNHYAAPAMLPAGACIGTSSLRRQAQLSVLFPKLKMLSLRGNVGSRLQKLDDGRYDAIILATAGLKRLQLSHRITQILPSRLVLPAVGQGAIGIECRCGDSRIESLISVLHHPATATCVSAERAFNRRLNGGCQVPIAGFACLQGDEQIWFRARVSDPDGQRLIEGELRGSAVESESLGLQLAENFLSRGADKILAAIGLHTD
ncbi:MAG: hydroxymethylbilane synthase [Gammaproteobacteria bacterium]|nr:hydroxymethylbilane synthase [Gammaproteobacteria bacterium]